MVLCMVPLKQQQQQQTNKKIGNCLEYATLPIPLQKQLGVDRVKPQKGHECSHAGTESCPKHNRHVEIVPVVSGK